MKPRKRSEQGFSVMEALISVAVLALISGFVLQMYIVSYRVNQRAQDKDTANSIVVTAVESIKTQKSFDDLSKAAFFKDCTFDGENGAYQYYDEKWRPMAVPQNADAPVGAKFMLRVGIPSVSTSLGDRYSAAAAKNNGAAAQTDIGMMAELVVSVVQLDGETVRELAKVEARKYYAY